ncbi:MAG: signal peptidase II [Bdellovibrionales bacterium]|nr:signal peptidase II [Bdellovibrionales bacterium]
MKFETKYFALILIAGAIVALDQATKMYVHTAFTEGEQITVLADYFNLTYVRNRGAAFGLGGDMPASLRSLFFLSVPPAVMLIILTMLWSTPSKQKLQVIALSLVFGGAIGNYIDRIRFGYVVDFLDFHLKNLYTWPAFNVADIAIVTGVCMIIYEIVLEWRQEVASKAEQES